MPRAGRAEAGAPARAPPGVLPVHRHAFVQKMMASGYMTEGEAKDVFKRLCGSTDDNLYRQMLADLNEEMKFANFQLRTVKFPVDEQRYIGFVNLLQDEGSKVATQLTFQQRDFFKAAMERIAMATSSSASDMELLNMEVAAAAAVAAAAGPSSQAASAAAAGSKRLSKVERQDTIDKLVGQGWLAFAPHRPGFYCLGPRAFLELGDFLMSLELPEPTRAAWAQVL